MAMSNKARHAHNERKLQEIHPAFRERARAYLAEAEKRGLQPKIMAAYRTPEAQLAAFNAGNSRLKRGMHQPGLAMDVVPNNLDERPKWDPQNPAWQEQRALAQELGLTILGQWDKGHIQATPTNRLQKAAINAPIDPVTGFAKLSPEVDLTVRGPFVPRPFSPNEPNPNVLAPSAEDPLNVAVGPAGFDVGGLARQYQEMGNRRLAEQQRLAAPLGRVTQGQPLDPVPNLAPPTPDLGGLGISRNPFDTQRSLPTIANMLSGMDSPMYGPGQVAPAGPPMATGAPLRGVGSAVAPVSDAPAGSLSALPQGGSMLGRMPGGMEANIFGPGPSQLSPQGQAQVATMPNERLSQALRDMDTVYGPSGTVRQVPEQTAQEFAAALAEDKMQREVSQSQRFRPDITAAPAPASVASAIPPDPRALGLAANLAGPATSSLAELATMRDRPEPPSLPQYDVSTAAPAFNTPPAVVADKVQPPVVAPQEAPVIGAPATNTQQREVANPVIGQPAPGIIGGSFPPAPTQADMAVGRVKGMFTNPMASMSQGLLGGLFQNPKASLGGALGGFMIGGLPGALLGGLAPSLGLGNPLKGLGSLFGGMPSAPNPTKTNYGTGLKAISDVLGGAGGPGATAYSRSTPGYSVTNLGNGYVAKTNQYGKTSYEFTGFPSTMKDSGWFGGKSSSSGFSGFGSGRTASKSEASKYSGHVGLH